MYALGSRIAWIINSRLNFLEPAALSSLIFSRSQLLSASVRNVAFSGYCRQQMTIKAA